MTKPQRPPQANAATPANTPPDIDIDAIDAILNGADEPPSESDIKEILKEAGADDDDKGPSLAEALADGPTTPHEDIAALPINQFGGEEFPPGTGETASPEKKQKIIDEERTRIPRLSAGELADINDDLSFRLKEKTENDRDNKQRIESEIQPYFEDTGIQASGVAYHPLGREEFLTTPPILDELKGNYHVALPVEAFFPSEEGGRSPLAKHGFTAETMQKLLPQAEAAKQAGQSTVEVVIPVKDMVDAIYRKEQRIPEAEKLFSRFPNGHKVNYLDNTGEYEVVVSRPVMENVLRKNETESVILPKGEWKTLPATVHWRVPASAMESVIGKDTSPEGLPSALRRLKPFAGTKVTKSQGNDYYLIQGVPIGTPLSALFTDEETQKAIKPGKTCTLLIPKQRMEQLLAAAAPKPKMEKTAQPPEAPEKKINYAPEKFLALLQKIFPGKGYQCSFKHDAGCFIVEGKPDAIARDRLGAAGMDAIKIAQVKFESGGPLKITIPEAIARATYDAVAAKVEAAAPATSHAAKAPQQTTTPAGVAASKPSGPAHKA